MSDQLGLLRDVLRSQEWIDDALCAQTAPDAFFPEKGESPSPAKQICFTCGVRLECLAYAMAGNERYGVWGGMATRERDKKRPQWLAGNREFLSQVEAA
jgi:WhiB family redox-sensing transcriptional regulator